jgi:hypothetical protein
MERFLSLIHGTCPEIKEHKKADHKQIQADFSEKLIKRQKIYPAGLKSYLMDMEGVRNQADYTFENISRKLAFRQIVKAKEMISAIGKELEK